MVRNFIRDKRGRFASRSGTVSAGRRPKPQPKGNTITRRLRQQQRQLYRAEQAAMANMGGNVAGMRLIRGNIRRGAQSMMAAIGPATSSRPPGRVSDALRSTLRTLAQSDARKYREVADIARQLGASTPRQLGGRKRSTRKRLGPGAT